MPGPLLLVALLGADPSACRKVAESESSSASVGATTIGDLTTESEPLIDISGTALSGEVQFGRAIDATRLQSGMIVVADVAEGSLVFFDPSGKVVKRSGRKGQGPGEYQYLSWLHQCQGDTLFTWDPILGRVSVVDSAGRVVRQFRLPGRPSRLSCARNGTFAVIMRVTAMRLPSAESPVHTATLTFANVHGDSVGSLGEIRVGQNRPLAAIAQFAMAGDRLYLGTGDSASVGMYALDGRWQGAISVGAAGRPSTPAHYERAIDKLVAGMTPAERTTIKEQLLAIPMPPQLPAYSNLLTDPAGWLWAVTSVPGDGVTIVQASEPDGRVVGEVRLPVEMDVFEIGIDYLLGAYQLPDGEQRVAAYQFRRSR